MSEKRDPFISEVAAMLGLTEDAARDTILRDLRHALRRKDRLHHAVAQALSLHEAIALTLGAHDKGPIMGARMLSLTIERLLGETNECTDVIDALKATTSTDLDSIRNALKLDHGADTSEILASIHALKNAGLTMEEQAALIQEREQNKRNLEQLADVARWLDLDPLQFTGHDIKCSIDAIKATNDRLQVQVAKQRDAVTRTELLQMDCNGLRDKLTTIAKGLGISRDASACAILDRAREVYEVQSRAREIGGVLGEYEALKALGLPANADHELVLNRIKELTLTAQNMRETPNALGLSGSLSSSAIAQNAIGTAQLLTSLKKEREQILDALGLPVETSQGADILGRIKNLKLSCTEPGPTARELEKIAKELGLSKEANVHVICAKIAFLHDAKNLADRYTGLVKCVARFLGVDENENAIRNELNTLVIDISEGVNQFRFTVSDGPLSSKVKVLNADHAKLQEWDRRAYEGISSVTGDTSSHKPTILASLTSFAITASVWKDRYKKLLQGLNEDVGLVAPLEGTDHAKAEDEVRSQVRFLVQSHENLREIREVLSAVAPITPSTTAMAKWAVKNLNELTVTVSKVRSALNGAK